MKLSLTIGILLSGLFLFSGCATVETSNRVLAVVEHDFILEKDVNKNIPRGYFETDEKLYPYQKKELTRLVVDKLLQFKSKKEGITVSELLAKNVYTKLKSIKREAQKAYFKTHSERFKHVTFKEAQNMIKDVLYREQKREALTTFYNELIKNGNVRILLTPATN